MWGLGPACAQRAGPCDAEGDGRSQGEAPWCVVGGCSLLVFELCIRLVFGAPPAILPKVRDRLSWQLLSVWVVGNAPAGLKRLQLGTGVLLAGVCGSVSPGFACLLGANG